MPKTIAILGSTGSIGRQTLDVLRHIEGYKVVSLACDSNIDLLEQQILEFSPAVAAVANEDAGRELARRLNGFATKIAWGYSSLAEASALDQADIVLAATSGVSGISASYSAAALGKTIALANKETLVCAGSLMMKAANDSGSLIIPVDSEHSAIFQCIQAGNGDVKKILLTASGGPFRGKALKDMENVSIDSALNHPNWKMGKKITIDSATLMNKGFEWIEAKWLFSLEPEQIEILIQPNSMIHSAVEFLDGSIIAQLGPPDMRGPIQYALTYPLRFPSLIKPLDFSQALNIELFPADFINFPCLEIAKAALHSPGSMSAAIAAADDIAVEAFIEGRIKFLGIAKALEGVMKLHSPFEPSSISEVEEVISESKILASEIVESLSKE